MTTFHILGAKGRAVKAVDLITKAQAVPFETLPLNAGKVCGRGHLESAVLHALRSIEQGTNSSTSKAMETMLYASGEKQISKAKEKMGVKDGLTDFAVIIFDSEDPDAVLDALGLVRDDSVLDSSDEKAAAFGIEEAEAKTGNIEDLVLERVAFVEILKR